MELFGLRHRNVAAVKMCLCKDIEYEELNKEVATSSKVGVGDRFQ